MFINSQALISAGAATAAREALKDKQHEANVVAAGGQFYPLIVETFYGLFDENAYLWMK